MRGSKGVSEPLIASVDSAPATTAACITRSAPMSAARAMAVETWVPLSSARPSLGPSTTGSRPTRARAAAPPRVRPSIWSFALADCHERQMGERREVAGGADRALGGDHGEDVMGDHRGQQIQGCRGDAGMTTAQRLDLQEQDQPHDLRCEGRAGAGGMRADQIDLKSLQIGVGNARLGELAEAGVDAIDRLAGGEELIDQGMALGNGGDGCGSDVEGDRPGEGMADIVQGEIVGVDDDRGAFGFGHHSLPGKARNGAAKAVAGGGLVDVMTLENDLAARDEDITDRRTAP